LDIATSAFVSVGSQEELGSALQTLGTPCLLKTRRLGYDGKGQRRIAKFEEGPSAFEALGRVPCLLEQWIPFSRELSLLCARSVSGELAFYPLVQNVHHEGILRLTLAPAPGLTEALQQLAQQYAERLLGDLDYVGVLAIEFFDVAGQLLVNEFAPRVHNSGHFTIEGAVTSQFENHLRAITNFPLGDTSIRGSVAMLNLVGAMPNPVDVLINKDAHLHDYGKEPRAGRKLGHITLVARDETERAERLAAIEPVLVNCGAVPRDVILKP
jgi:5-(carboxyamino)imidazole ribonucleotide synthase